MKALVSLQIYAARRHATGAVGSAAETSEAFGRYPHRRIAIAWHSEPEHLEGGATNPDHAPNEELANRIALALRAAYRPGGTAADACAREETPDWCGISVPDRSTPDEPDALRPRFNPCWIKNFDPREGQWAKPDGRAAVFNC